MNLIMFILFLTAAFLLGTLILALKIRVKQSDPSATYGLYSIRDRIIDASVFHGVPRDDPWLDRLYDAVNTILIGSNIIAGPGKGWVIAKKTGKMMAVDSSTGTVSPFPSTPPPEALVPIIKDFVDTLNQLIDDHMGWATLFHAEAKEKLLIQRARAMELRAAIQESHVQLLPV